MKVTSDEQDTSNEEASLPSDDGSVAELRSLLLGPAEAQLAEVHERLFDPQRQVEEVSRVLPDAIAVRSRRDDALTAALSSTVSTALQHSVRKNPQPLADALFPIMGPAIRKYIAAALNTMVQSLNQTMTHSMSARGLSWRLEALKTGRPFSEVVLLHTLRYRVEQVYLIHKETGLLLRHVSAAGAQTQDADMVSGMLTAIQDFVRDSFQTRNGDQLDTLQMGDLTVWVEQGPFAILAGVIRGNAPLQLREVFQSTLERIHLQFGSDLEAFAGDAEVFAPTEPLLEDCLQADYGVDNQQAGARKKITPLTVIASVLLIALLVGAFFWMRDRYRWNTYVDRLRNEPGFVVTDVGKLEGKHMVAGLRDPLSRDPQVLIQGTGLTSDSVIEKWQPFQALTPEFVIARAKKSLAPPSTVQLLFNDGTLEAKGFATHNWIVETRRVARFLPGINQFRDDTLLDIDSIENPLLKFEVNQSQLRDDQQQTLKQLVEDIRRLQQSAGEKKITLEISGRTDSAGSESLNATLGQSRAETVAAALKENLTASPNLVIRAVRVKDRLREEVTDEDRATNRSVNIKVIADE